MIHSCTLHPLRGIAKSQFHRIRTPWNLEGLERQLDRGKWRYYGLKHWAPQVLHKVRLIVFGNHCYMACVSVIARMICRMGAEFQLLGYYIQCVSRVVDIPVGDNILGLCNKMFVSTRALFSTVTVLRVFLILVMKLYYMLHDLELASDVIYSTLISAISCALFITKRQDALRKRVAFSKKCFQHRSV
jgi:hypothetical protein